jgi:serine/threonine-protein kinase HipA
MTLNGKRKHFVRDDFYTLEAISPLFSRRRINDVMDEITEQVSMWPKLARDHGVPVSLAEEITRNLRLSL